MKKDIEKLCDILLEATTLLNDIKCDSNKRNKQYMKYMKTEVIDAWK